MIVHILSKLSLIVYLELNTVILYNYLIKVLNSGLYHRPSIAYSYLLLQNPYIIPRIARLLKHLEIFSGLPRLLSAYQNLCNL